MQNIIDTRMPKHRQEQALLILNEMHLSGLRVLFLESEKSFRFLQDRRVVTVPARLVDSQSWADIRHLFRAILSESPAVGNHGAPNEWGPHDDPYRRNQQ